MKKQQVRPYPLRLQHDVSKWVRDRAKAGDRSINAEINRLLRNMKEEESQKQAA